MEKSEKNVLQSLGNAVKLTDESRYILCMFYYLLSMVKRKNYETNSKSSKICGYSQK